MQIKNSKLFPALTAAGLLAGLSAQAASFSTDFNSFGIPPGSTVAGSAEIDSSNGFGIGGSGVLKITSNAAGQQGGFYISDFASGAEITNFRLSAKVAIGGGTDRPADGMAFAFGSSVPGGGFGEEGAGNGIIVTFDTWDNNGGDTAPSIELKYPGLATEVRPMSTGGAGNPWREGGRQPFGYDADLNPDPIIKDGAGNPLSLQTFKSNSSPNDASFVDLTIELFADNTLSLSWSNVVVLDHIAIPYTPVAGGTFAFGARTGGATEFHLIDNLQIYANFNPGPVTLTEQPQDATITETKTATFSVALDGTPPFSVKWYRNDVEIPGADQPSYTTPPANLGMDGSRYHAEVTNPLSPTPVKSSDAILHVGAGTLFLSGSTRGQTDKVYLNFSKGVNLDGSYTIDGGVGVTKKSYGASHSEVVLDVTGLVQDANYNVSVTGVTGEDNSVLIPAQVDFVLHHGFGAYCNDFETDDILPGATGGRAAIGDNGSGDGRAMHLTDNGVGGACGQFFIPNLAGDAPLANLHAKWSSRVFSSGDPADGYSFNWGSDVAAGCSGSEEGNGSGLTVDVDTFDNGCGNCDNGTDIGLEIKWKGARVAYEHTSKKFLAKGTFVDAEVVVTPDGTATFTYDDVTLSAKLPGYGAGISKGNFAFVARTGGANEDAWLDNVCINSANLGAVSIVTPPADATTPVGSSATFTAQVDGSYPYSYQWLVNGQPVPGATGSRFTVKAASILQDNSKVSVIVKNDFSTATSSEATLHVDSAANALGNYCHDFDDNILPEGSKAFSNIAGFNIVGGSAADGIIHLTEAHVNGANGVLWIPDQNPGVRLDRLLARWRTLIGAGDGSGADGYSFNWGFDVPNNGGNTEGTGTGLSVTVDTWDNGCGNCQDNGSDLGIEIKWNANRVAYLHTDKAALRKNQFVDTEVSVTPEGLATFNFDGLVISANLPGYHGIVGGNFSFAASTGGENDNQWIDDVRINCFDLGNLAVTQQPADVTIQPGQSASFVADVDGLFPYSYQWTSNNVAIPGANYRLYTTPALNNSADGAKYKLTITNPRGTISTREAVISLPPTLAIANVGNNVTLSWVASGYTLQSTKKIESDPSATVWTTVGTTSPVNQAVSSSESVFYRLIKN